MIDFKKKKSSIQALLFEEKSIFRNTSRTSTIFQTSQEIKGILTSPMLFYISFSLFDPPPEQVEHVNVIVEPPVQDTFFQSPPSNPSVIVFHNRNF
jgi:hypothetical protein